MSLPSSWRALSRCGFLPRAQLLSPRTFVGRSFASRAASFAEHDEGSAKAGASGQPNGANACKGPAGNGRLLSHSSPLEFLKLDTVASARVQRNPHVRRAAAQANTGPQEPVKVKSVLLESLGIELDAKALDRKKKPPKPSADAIAKSNTKIGPSRPGFRAFESRQSTPSRTGSFGEIRAARSMKLEARPIMSSKAQVQRFSPPAMPGETSVERWSPKKKVARSTMDRIRFLHAQDPQQFSVRALSATYRISYEAVKRILHSKYVPRPERADEMDRKRTERRREWRNAVAVETRARLAQERRERSRQTPKAEGYMQPARVGDGEAASGNDQTGEARYTTTTRPVEIAAASTRPPTPPSQRSTTSAKPSTATPGDWGWLRS